MSIPSFHNQIPLFELITQNREVDNIGETWEWYENDRGEIHRENGPASIEWYANGNMKYQEYYQNGKYHRLDGSAITHWNEDGSLAWEIYYIHGEQVDSF